MGSGLSGAWGRSLPYCCQHGVRIGQDLVVPEAEDPEATPAQLEVPRSVTHIFGVLAAIDFHNQVMLEAGEIDDGTTDRHLPAELEAVQPAIAQPIPQAHLGIR